MTAGEAKGEREREGLTTVEDHGADARGDGKGVQCGEGGVEGLRGEVEGRFYCSTLWGFGRLLWIYR